LAGLTARRARVLKHLKPACGPAHEAGVEHRDDDGWRALPDRLSPRELEVVKIAEGLKSE
jgi:hypothetical protein